MESLIDLHRKADPRTRLLLRLKLYQLALIAELVLVLLVRL